MAECVTRVQGVQGLIDEDPRFHMTDSGQLVSWRLNRATLDYLERHVPQHSRTLETGSGMSTVLFALKGSRHICITPDQGEIDRITEYCHQRRISLDRVSFVVERSENALPNLAVRELDLVLIDGRHAFPSPFIDWYYTVDKLRLGGRLIIDDTQVWTVSVLRDFMLSEPEWQLDETLGRASAFVKVQEENHSKWFALQALVFKRSPTEIIRVCFDQAFDAYRRGDTDTGNDKVAYVLRNVPHLRNDAESLAQAIVTRVLSSTSDNNKEEELRQVAEMVCDQLPTRVRRYTMATLHEALAFRSQQSGALGAARANVLRAIALDCRRLTNRGLMSVLAETIFGSAVMQRWRRRQCTQGPES